MKKRILKALCFFLSGFVVLSGAVFAVSVEETESRLSQCLLEEYLELCKPEEVVFDNGGKIVFYEEYSSNENALIAFKQKYPQVYEKMKTISEKDIDSFQDWEDGHDAYMYACVELKHDGEITKEEYYDAVHFVGNYFHKYMNLAIRESKSIEELRNYVSDKYIDDLDSIQEEDLKTYKNISDADYDKSKEKFSPLASWNDYFYKYRGIDYAEEYAVIPSPRYDVFNRDCTNFVSQILEAGRVRQDRYWWHEVEYSYEGVDIHRHSVTWVRANAFSRHMGKSRPYYSYYSLVMDIPMSGGVFLGADYDDDGWMDHMGFVVDVRYDRSLGRDLKIAQHSRNYLKWVSEYDNHWEEVEDDRGAYYIVR